MALERLTTPTSSLVDFKTSPLDPSESARTLTGRGRLLPVIIIVIRVPRPRLEWRWILLHSGPVVVIVRHENTAVSREPPAARQWWQAIYDFGPLAPASGARERAPAREINIVRRGGLCAL